MRAALPSSLVSVALLAFIVACESGKTVIVDVTVPDAAVAAFTEEAPGVLRLGSESVFTLSIGAMCGQTVDTSAPVHVVHDLGFGCLADDQAGTTEPVSVWIEPSPAGYDATAVCAAGAVVGEVFSVSAPADADPAPPELAEDVDASFEHQGEGTLTWRRDLSPCGGVGEGSVTLE